MSAIRGRIERRFQQLGHWICRRAWLVIVLLALAVGGLASQGSRVVMDTSPEGMLRKGDTVRLQYDAFRRDFRGDSSIVVGVRGPEPFDDDFLARLDALHRDLERDVPHVKHVTSLVNARYTRSEDDAFVVGDLLEDWRARRGDAGSLQRFARHHPLYRDNLVSADGRFVALVLEPQALISEAEISLEDPLAAFDALRSEAAPPARYFAQKERAEMVDRVKDVLARHERPGFDLVLSGSPVLVDAFDRTTLRDTTLCVTASAIGILLVLWLFFRRVSGVILPNIVVSSAISATIGVMGLVGAPFTLSTPGIFAILIAVGTCSVIHLLTIFYRRLEGGASRPDAVAFALGHAGPAIVMTSLTTGAGLLSFADAPLASAADMGVFSAVGVLFCLILSLALVPAILAVAPIRADVRTPAGSRAVDRGLVALAGIATAHHRRILAVSLAVFVVGAYGSQRVRFSHDPVSYFHPDATVRTDLEIVDRELSGGTTLELVIDSGRENGLYEPSLLQRIDEAGRALPQIAADLMPTSRIFSVNDVVKETHQALHENDPARYEIPAERATLSQELFLFEQSGSDDLGRLVDPQYRTARVTIKTPYADGIVYREFVSRVEALFRDRLDGLAEVTATGAMALEARAIPYALETMARSYGIAFVVISVMMVAFLGSLRVGLVAMIPNLLPLVAVMGLMGFGGLPIDMTTITVASIGLGLVVDDTIHFLYNFQKYHDETGDVTAAVEQSFLGVGRAMIVTSGVLVVCFWVDLFASLSNVNRFGFLVGLVVLVALATDFLLAPALMRLLKERRQAAPVTRKAALRAGAAVLVLLLAPLRSVGAEMAAGPDARTIMERVEARDDGESVTMDLHMTLVDQSGRTRERRARSYGRDRPDGGTDSLIFFLEPADVRGTGFLTHDDPDPARSDDQWLFLPALGRSKRISSSEKSRPFMGSDFSYADMTRRSPDRYEYTLMREVEVNGHLAWQIQATPSDDAERRETGYRKSIVFVRKDNDVVVRAVHWLDASDEVKMLDVQRLERVDGIWTPLEVQMGTGRGGRVEHTTVLRATRVEYDQALPAGWFSTRQLEKGP